MEGFGAQSQLKIFITPAIKPKMFHLESNSVRIQQIEHISS